MNNKEYTEILQRIVEVLQQEERKNSTEKECQLLSLFTRIEVLLSKNDSSNQILEDSTRNLEVIKRLTEVVLRERDTEQVPILLSIINNPF